MSLDADDGTAATVCYDFVLRDGWIVLSLLRVLPQDAATPLHYMQGLAAESDPRDRSIRLDIGVTLFTLIARYLATGLPPPRITFAADEWLPFVRACDYLGLGHLPAALTDNADIAFLSALTRPDARVALRERRVRRRAERREQLLGAVHEASGEYRHSRAGFVEARAADGA